MSRRCLGWLPCFWAAPCRVAWPGVTQPVPVCLQAHWAEGAAGGEQSDEAAGAESGVVRCPLCRLKLSDDNDLVNSHIGTCGSCRRRPHRLAQKQHAKKRRVLPLRLFAARPGSHDARCCARSAHLQTHACPREGARAAWAAVQRRKRPCSNSLRPAGGRARPLVAASQQARRLAPQRAAQWAAQGAMSQAGHRPSPLAHLSLWMSAWSSLQAADRGSPPITPGPAAPRQPTRSSRVAAQAHGQPQQ